MAMAGGSPGPDADPRLRGLSRRLSELRRNAKAEVSKLKSQLAASTGQVEALKGIKDEYAKMKAIYEASSAQLGSVRDDNSRKAKLLSSMKAAKATDNNAVEQWRNEVSELEEKVKRQGRAIASKDSIIRDLKSRIEEEVSEAVASGDVHTATLTANELRQRLRVADLERARARSRVGSMKDKISELEAELALLREEGQRLRRTSDRAEATRAALARKDALFRSQKAALEKVKAELDDVREDANSRLAEGERRVRNLQRQLAETEEQRLEAERECELMRRRATGSAVRLGEYPADGVVTRDVADYVNTGRAAHSAAAASGGGGMSAREALKQSLRHRSAPAPVAPSPPRQQQQQQARQTRPTDVAAALSLGLDADDLGDVIAALGDNTGTNIPL
jgi:chromosome segregation ATPase